MKKILTLFGVVVIAVVLIMIFTLPEVFTSAPPQINGVVSSGSNSKGSEQATVTVVEYSDFQCPFCSKFYTETLPQIQDNYISQAKVKFVYKHFPLSFHKEAFPAALASECAGEQGKFWEMHDKLYENQGSLSTANYKQWASEFGLDAQQFNSCFDTGKYNDKINNDYQEGQSLGITGTPSFTVNGQKIIGAKPFFEFQTAIDNALAT